MLSLIAAAVAMAASPLSNCMINGQNPATLAYLRSVQRAPNTSSTVPTPGYVRIVARYTDCYGPSAESLRVYELERRDFIRRFFMHKIVNKNLTLNISVRPLGVSATKSLVAIGRDSGKEGETWATEIGNDLTILPYFRVEPNTTIQLSAAYLSDRTYKSSVISDTLDVINRATALITPTAQLITESNKAKFNDASTFVDSTINGMLRVEIKETLRSDTLLTNELIFNSQAQNGQNLAVILLYVTGANDPYNRNTREVPRPVGQWQIRAESFDGSLFGAVPKSGVPAAASVLNFQVTDGKRVRDLVAGDPLVAAARDAVLKKPSKEGAGALCRAIAARADTEGFSANDTGWIVAAYLYEMAPSAEEDSPLRQGCGPVSKAKQMYTQEAALKS